MMQTDSTMTKRVHKHFTVTIRVDIVLLPSHAKSTKKHTRTLCNDIDMQEMCSAIGSHCLGKLIKDGERLDLQNPLTNPCSGLTFENHCVFENRA